MTAATYEATKEYAESLDREDSLFLYRERFHIPQKDGEPVIYLCGHSLGLQPKSTSYLMQLELDDWAKHGVEGHWKARNPWASYQQLFTTRLSKMVGAQPTEVVAAHSLSVNLHLLMMSFYRPTKQRYKIIMENGAFSSDQYAIETQVILHGFLPSDAIIEVAPRKDEHTIQEEDLLLAIETAGDSLALVLLGGVNYYTGQFFNLKKVTTAAHQVGALAGFDLAHAIGNVPLQLHDWDVDFACWCSYKYLNSGPGGVGGIFVHDKHITHPDTFRLGGWWGTNESTRFNMPKGYVPDSSAASWQLSSPSILNMVAHHASLDIFDKVGMVALREKSIRMTAYLEFLLKKIKHLPFKIITPSNPESRGNQLSLWFSDNGKAVFEALLAEGVIVDWREPNVIRMAPAPLYNSFEDLFRLYDILNKWRF